MMWVIPNIMNLLESTVNFVPFPKISFPAPPEYPQCHTTYQNLLSYATLTYKFCWKLTITTLCFIKTLKLYFYLNLIFKRTAISLNGFFACVAYADKLITHFMFTYYNLPKKLLFSLFIPQQVLNGQNTYYFQLSVWFQSQKWFSCHQIESHTVFCLYSNLLNTTAWTIKESGNTLQ